MSQTGDEPRVKGLAEAPIQQYLLYDAIDNSHALIFVADENMQYIAVNETACATLGYSREELLSLRVSDIAAGPGSGDAFRKLLEQSTLAGDTQIRAKDGRLLPLAYRASEVRVAGMPYYLCIGFTD